MQDVPKYEEIMQNLSIMGKENPKFLAKLNKYKY